VLGHYARDLGLFPLEEAVHRMTGLSARRFGLDNRGIVAPGAHADLVVLDPARVIDRATYAEPTRMAEGIDCVIVGGVVTYGARGATGDRNGRFLHRGRSQ
jgi:N-acyl-D-amino-acid deacylase